MSTAEMPVCDFCGKAANVVKRMVAGSAKEAHICGVCIRECVAIIAEEAAIEGSLNVGRKVIPFDKPFPMWRA